MNFLYVDFFPEEEKYNKENCQSTDQMKQKIHYMVSDHIISVPGGDQPYLIVDGMSDHKQGPVHPCLRIPAESGWIREEFRNIGDLANVDVLLDVMKIIVVPVGCEGVGVENKEQACDQQYREQHGSFLE